MVVQRMIQVSIAPAMECAMKSTEHVTATTITMVLRVKFQNVRMTVQELWVEDNVMARGNLITITDIMQEYFVCSALLLLLNV